MLARFIVWARKKYLQVTVVCLILTSFQYSNSTFLDKQLHVLYLIVDGKKTKKNGVHYRMDLKKKQKKKIKEKLENLNGSFLKFNNYIWKQIKNKEKLGRLS